MDETIEHRRLDAPAGWAEALAESKADIAAGRTIPVEHVLARLDESLNRMRAQMTHPSGTAFTTLNP